MLTFSNPRLHAEFNDWPLGGSKRGPCRFDVEFKPKKGWRFVRTTTGKAKTATFSGRCAIVDGSDGRTYLLQCAGPFADFVKVMRSDFMDASEAMGGENGAASVFPNNPRFDELKGLIDETKPIPLNG